MEFRFRTANACNMVLHKSFSKVCLAPALLCAMITVASAASLPPPVAPPGYQRPASTGGRAMQCPPIPEPYTGPLRFGSKYAGSGPARDTVNAAAEEAYQSATAAIHAFETAAADLTDAYLRSGDAGDLACLIHLFERWAAAHGLEGEALDYGGKSVRKWALASAAGSYLRLANSSSQPLRGFPVADGNARAWMSRLADLVVAEWDLNAPQAKINNQTYWAGWAVMAAGVLTGRRDLYNWGLASLQRGLGQIDADGYLPSELARGNRALAYHAYALQPLTMLAAFAKANGETALDTAALDRLVQRTLTGLDDPSMFTAKTGVTQNLSGLRSAQTYVWLEAYCWQTTCPAAIATRLAAARPLHANRLGGSVTAVFRP